MTPAQFEAFIRQRAAVHGVDPALAVNIWKAESGGKLGNLVGDQGRSVGPWQILNTTAPSLGLGLSERADPVRSTEAVMPMIRRLSDRARGDWALARLGYMRGDSAIDNPQRYASHPIAGGNMRHFAALQQSQRSAADALGLGSAPVTPGAAAPTMAEPQVAASPVPQFDAAMFDILGLENQAWPHTTTEATA